MQGTQTTSLCLQKNGRTNLHFLFALTNLLFWEKRNGWYCPQHPTSMLGSQAPPKFSSSAPKAVFSHSDPSAALWRCHQSVLNQIKSNCSLEAVIRKCKLTKFTHARRKMKTWRGGIQLCLVRFREEYYNIANYIINGTVQQFWAHYSKYILVSSPPKIFPPYFDSIQERLQDM